MCMIELVLKQKNIFFFLFIVKRNDKLLGKATLTLQFAPSPS